ncbi:MAG TPA: hypothetical protein VIV60_37275, partial [Polyangiaceae bacterium]
MSKVIGCYGTAPQPNATQKARRMFPYLSAGPAHQVNQPKRLTRILETNEKTGKLACIGRPKSPTA